MSSHHLLIYFHVKVTQKFNVTSLKVIKRYHIWNFQKYFDTLKYFDSQIVQNLSFIQIELMRCTFYLDNCITTSKRAIPNQQDKNKFSVLKEIPV